VTAKVQEGKGGCRGKTKRGTLCNANALRRGTVYEGVTVSGKWCLSHDEDVPPSARFGSRERAKERGSMGGRPRAPKPSEIAKRLIEQNELALQRPYWRTIGFDVVIGDDGPELVEMPNGGAKLHGESKTGEVIASPYEDLEAQQRAADRLQDRVYGKPKQSTELTGSEGGAIEIVPVSRDAAERGVALAAAVGGRG
jgi:hypothetical protein